MNIVNQKIIQAIIDKANKFCPDSLALIGIYGSVATGDAYEKSDLDLLVLIQNEAGQKLKTGFILEDSQVGYDIYCTSWAGLKYDAECHHAHISKLMDSQIVYIGNQEAYAQLCKLRSHARLCLESEERFERVHELVNKAKISYANACLREDIGEIRVEACGVMHYLSDAVMIYHGKYFKLGVKRAFEELCALPIDEMFISTMKKIAVCKDASELRSLLRSLILYTEHHVRRKTALLETEDILAGTYEEMYSNWRNKVEEAAVNKDAFASYMNMANLHYMLSNISEKVQIGTYNVMSEYSPDILEDNIRIFDQVLDNYEDVYKRAGLNVKRFADVDEFVESYMSE